MKKFIKIFIITIMITLILTLCFETNKEEKLQENYIDLINITNQVQTENVIESQENLNPRVIAKIEIPKINLNTDILNSSDEESLAEGICKFWGVNPNKIGNFCVAGHNYKRKNMFYRLRELKKENKIYITDNSGEKIEYIVYKIEKVTPDDISCLSQETDGKKEITLITCTLDSKKRIIVKARENIE